MATDGLGRAVKCFDDFSARVESSALISALPFSLFMNRCKHWRPGSAMRGTPLGETLSEPTVFIVDDDDACRDAVRELVFAVGLAAAVFSSGSEFLAAVDPSWHGCLVLDQRMPGMTGLALQKRLLEMDVRIPIVFVSGSVDIPTAVQSIKDGAVDFLEKPYPQQQLLDAIYKALRRGSSQGA
jgi:FixJ family two-component response regulator